MRKQLKCIALLLTMVLCLSATACAVPQNSNVTTPLETTPTVTPEETTPTVTPEASTPAETPEDTTPAATPEESTTMAPLEETTPTFEETTPVTTPEETTSDEGKPDSELPVAEDDLTAEQMAEIEAAFGSEIDWDKYYFGTHGGYVYFGTADGSKEYYSAKNYSKTTVYFGYVNAVYTFKDGVIADAGETFVDEKLDMDLSLTIGGIAIRKTIGALPNIYDDLTEKEIESLKNAAGYKNPPEFYYGVYNGYVVYTAIEQVGEGIKLKVPNLESVGLLMVDTVYTYKDGVLTCDGRGNLPEGILTQDDMIRIQFIHYALVAELYCKPYGEIY